MSSTPEARGRGAAEAVHAPEEGAGSTSRAQHSPTDGDQRGADTQILSKENVLMKVQTSLGIREEKSYNCVGFHWVYVFQQRSHFAIWG